MEQSPSSIGDAPVAGSSNPSESSPRTPHPFAVRESAGSIESREAEESMQPHTSFHSDVKLSTKQSESGGGAGWSEPIDMRHVAHAAIMRAAQHATGPDGKPLNILEPIAESFTINSSMATPRHVQSYGCMMVVNGQTRIISHCSENVKSVLDFQPADLIGHDIQQLLKPDQVVLLFQGAEQARAATDANRSMSHPAYEEKVESKKDESSSSSGSPVVPPLASFKDDDVPMREIDGIHFAIDATVHDRDLTVIAHQPDGAPSIVLDFLPLRPTVISKHDLGVRLIALADELEQANNIYRGAQICVEQLNAVLQYDRAMIYRLLPPDYHAEAIAEERRMTDLYPFLGLKFPAVSKEERDCYVDVGARFIEDTTSFPSLILGSFDHLLRPRTIVSPRGTRTTLFSMTPSKSPDVVDRPRQPSSSPPPSARAESGATMVSLPESSPRTDTSTGGSPTASAKSLPRLDLSHSLLRNPTPTHLSVLRSLGVRGSTTISVTVARELYGVLAFYRVSQPNVLPHGTQRAWCWAEYQFVRAASIIFANWIARQEKRTRQQQHEQLIEISSRLQHALDRRFEGDPKGVLLNIVFGHPNLCEIAGSDTFAFHCGDSWLRVGSLPAQSWLEGFQQWILHEAPDQRAGTGVDWWQSAEKVWSTINLSHDYPGPTPDPRLAAGALVIVMKNDPPTSFMCFRIETKSSEVWDGFDSSGVHNVTEAHPPGRTIPTTGGALTVAEITAKASSSAFAQQFLRAFQLSTHSSCAPWPVNAFPLLKVITNCLARYGQIHGWNQFFQDNIQNLVMKTASESTLASRLLREELDGLLLLSRSAPRTRPIQGRSSPNEERGGGVARHGKDCVLCVNQGWCEVFGFVDETAELREHDIEKALGTAGVPITEIMHPLFDTTRTITVWSRKKGHTTISFKCFHVYSVLQNDDFMEIVAFTFSDVTLQQRVEQALLLAHQQSRRSEQAKQRMIGMVSHELRTPLTAILGFSEILANDLRLNHEQREFVADIHSAGSHLLNIITNLLDLTKYELKDSKKQLVDVIEIVKDAALWLKKTLATKLLTLHLRLPAENGDPMSGWSEHMENFIESPLDQNVPPGPGSPSQMLTGAPMGSTTTSSGKSLAKKFRDAKLMKLYTLGDAVSLKRVIINLLDNSAKFTPKLGTITVSGRPLPPLVPMNPGFIEISIRDTGIGMSSSILDKIWEPFYQADLSAARELGGAGLGLAMVKSIVELHDGSVSVESEVGSGSKFTISLPMVQMPGPNDVPLPDSACQATPAASPVVLTPRSRSGSPVSDPLETLIKMQISKTMRDVRQRWKTRVDGAPSPRSPGLLTSTGVLHPGFGSSSMLPSAESELRFSPHARHRRGSVQLTRSLSGSSSPSSPAEKSPKVITEPQAFTFEKSEPVVQAIDTIRARMESPRISPRSLGRLSGGGRTGPVFPPTVSSRAVPSLRHTIPHLDPIGLEDSDETEIRKLGIYSTTEPNIPPKTPPAVKVIEGRRVLEPRDQSTTIFEHDTTKEPYAGGSTVGPPGSTRPQVTPTGFSGIKSTGSESSKGPKGKFHHIKIMVVDDSEINKKLFCRLLAMEGFTNIETAAHGLECVEKLIIFRDQSLIQWKKNLEIQQEGSTIAELTGNQQKAWQVDTARFAPDEAQVSQEEAASLRQRATEEAQRVASDLLKQLGLLEASHTTANVCNEHQRQQLMRHAVNEILSKERSTRIQQEIELPAAEKDSMIGASPTGRPLASVADCIPHIHVPAYASALIPKLVFLDLHMPLLDGFQTALAILKLGFDMPIAALTASVGASDQAMAEQLGFQRYLTKPLVRDDLRSVLKLAIEKYEKDRLAGVEALGQSNPFQRMGHVAEIASKLQVAKLKTESRMPTVSDAEAPSVDAQREDVTVPPNSPPSDIVRPEDILPESGQVSPTPSPPPT